MGSEVNVDWGQLQRSADAIDAARAKAEAEAQAFQAKMASYGEPWGNNNGVGQAIGACYGAVHQMHTDCNNENLSAYNGYVKGMRDMANTGQGAEQDTGDRANSLRMV